MERTVDGRPGLVAQLDDTIVSVYEAGPDPGCTAGTGVVRSCVRLRELVCFVLPYVVQVVHPRQSGIGDEQRR